LALLCLLLALPGIVLAQTTAPPWDLVTSSRNNMTANSVAYASAVDAAGNVFVTGGFTGTLSFGSIPLTSRGNNDVFVAKWDATTQAYTWATSGGGTGDDYGYGIAVNGTGVFVTGAFRSASSVSLAGQALPGAGDRDVFVVKYLDTSTGHTPATSSFATGWVVSGGGPGDDYGNSIAVSGPGVFVTGSFASGARTSLAGQVLSGAGGLDVFIAKYVDTSTGSTPATSSVANGWATSGGGTGRDEGYSIAVQGKGLFVTGKFTSASNARFAGQTLVGAGGYDVFVAKYLDMSTGSFANGWATSGGGTADDAGLALAMSNSGVFVTGYFTSGTATSLAGQALPGAGSTDMFVAKYVDTSTGSTPATSSFANGWATSGGGQLLDQGQGIAVRGKEVFVTGYFQTNTRAYLAGQSLGGAGTIDVFLAKYVDTSTGSTPATSSFANGWATSGGGSTSDQGLSVAISGQQVYVVGLIQPYVYFGTIFLGNAPTGTTDFLARITDSTVLVPPSSPTPQVSFGVAGSPVCQGEISVFTATVSPAMPSATISWDFGEPLGGPTNTAVGLTAQHQYAQAGTYQVTLRVTTVNGQTYTYSQPVLILARLVTQLRATSSQCTGQPVILSIEPTPPSGTRYTWQDGSSSTTPMLTVNASGVYWVDITSPQLCPQRDSFRLTLAPSPQVNLGPDRTIGCKEMITLDATSSLAGSSYRWQDGSTQAQYTAVRPGSYTVTVTAPSGCVTQETVNLQATAACEVVIPNIITPNNDQQNDQFVIEGLAAGSFALVIYNRWGREVYQQATYFNTWDAAGEADGIYYYLVTAPTGQRFKGWVEVLHVGK
jgi:gliding motility-associated-like protein